jgi:hypothetical protein
MYDLCTDHNSDQYIMTIKELQLLVGRTTKKYTAELVQSIETLTLELPEEPPEPANDATHVTVELWKAALKVYTDKTQVFQDFKAYVYNVVLGQSTDALQNRLRSHGVVFPEPSKTAWLSLLSSRR